MNAAELTQNVKVAAVTSGMTVTTGMGTILDFIPDDIGKLATLIGATLSIVLIRTHWRKGQIEYDKAHYELETLKRREAERLAAKD